MKYTNIYLPIIIFTLFGLSSCEKLFDDLQPIGQSTENEQFANQVGAEQVLLACYDLQRLYEFDLNILDCYGSLGMGLSTAASDWHSALEGNIPPGSIQGQIWENYYFQIADCNDFIRNVNTYNTTFRPAERKDQAIAEARALRAFAYFMLVQSYGDVPLMTESNFSELYPSRTPQNEIYQLIIADLEFASEKLSADVPEGIFASGQKEWGRITKYAATSMLGKVLLTAPADVQDLNRATELFQEVIDEAGYSLLPDWANVFNPDFRTNNPEMIWPIMFTNAFAGGGGKIAHYARPDDTWWRPEFSMYEKYDDTDIRRDSTLSLNLRRIRDENNQLTFDTVLYLIKYRQGWSGDERDNHPYYAMRYPEVLLMQAEALTKINFNANKTAAVTLLNQVRNRANATPAEDVDFPDQDSFFDALIDEFHKEFYFEFNTWLTLRRFGMQKTFEMQGINYVEANYYKFYLPLPSAELLRNPNLYQNDGYSTE